MSYASLLLLNSRFLGFGLFLTLMSSFGQTYFIALFGSELRQEFQLSHGEFGSVYAIATLASGGCLIWAGRAVDRLDLRLLTLLVLAGLAVASLGLAHAGSVATLGLALFGLRLCGQGLLGHVSMVSMARYFDLARGRAVSIAALGYPLGEALLPFVAVASLAAFGWRQSWTLVALSAVLLAAPLALLLLAGKPYQRVRESGHTESSTRRIAAGLQQSLRQVLTQTGFYLLLPAVLAPSFIVTGLFFHQRHLAEVKNWSLEWLAGAFVAFAMAQVAASLWSGLLVDKVGARRMLPFFLLPLAAAMLVLTYWDSLYAAPLYMIAAGITAGTGSTVFGALWAELYGVRHLGSIRAFVMALMVFSTALSPPSFGWLIDRSVAFDSLTLGLAIYCLVISGFIGFVPAPDRGAGVTKSKALDTTHP